MPNDEDDRDVAFHNQVVHNIYAYEEENNRRDAEQGSLPESDDDSAVGTAAKVLGGAALLALAAVFGSSI